MNQNDLEKQYSRRAIRARIKDDVDINHHTFKSCVEAIDKYIAKTYTYPSKNTRIAHLRTVSMTTEDIVLELFASILPYQVTSPIQSVSANLGSRLGYPHLLDSIRTASEIIAVCEPSGLYTIYHSEHADNDTDTLGILPHYRLSQALIDHINQTMFLPPLLCKPKDWASKDNTGGGYLESKRSCILGAMNHHSNKQAHYALNVLQSIPWEFNEHMLEHAECPNKDLETEEQVNQFMVFKQEAIEIRKMLTGFTKRFYFSWFFDKRGRSYSSGYHINIQSTEYQKSVIQFANKEKLIQ